MNISRYKKRIDSNGILNKRSEHVKTQATRGKLKYNRRRVYKK